MFEGNKLPNTPEAVKAMEQWKQFKNYIKRNRQVQRYNSLFSGAMYTPKFIADRATKDQFYQGSISFVKIPLAIIPDTEIKVTDADLKAYMDKHAAQYRVDEASRSIEYVSFDIKPSSDDTAKSLTALQKLKPEFGTAADAESFVNRNSEEPFNGAFVTKKSFMSPYTDSIMNLSAGSVFGPYYDNGSFKLTKVLEKKALPDSVKVRHILVKTEERGNVLLADSIAKKKIDSAELAIKSGVDFKEVVARFSEDAGSKETGGEYDFSLSQRSGISKEFADVAFEGRVGEKKIVKVDNDAYAGYHYIEVLEQKSIQEAAKLATISKSLYAGDETQNASYAQATEFAGRNTNEKAFDEAVKSKGLNKLQAPNVKVNDFVVPGLGSSREVIRWMYDAKVGDVSQVFDIDGRYIVAKLTDIQDKGMTKLNTANRPAIEAQVKAEKKAEKIAEKYKGNNLAAIAQSSGQQVQNADSFNAATNFFPAIGFEPKVVGYTFFDGLKPGTVSPAIKGQDGVFYITLKSRQQNPIANADPMQSMQQQMMQQMQLKNSVATMRQEALRKHADIKYSAKNLY
ncbi:MAG: hypothetical protein EOO02_15760 [Chitinophagaceae bacterium]|nr:MAG: hypothetical protein EOO02_15760 [Chitinophagaceae bacterium]